MIINKLTKKINRVKKVKKQLEPIWVNIPNIRPDRDTK